MFFLEPHCVMVKLGVHDLWQESLLPGQRESCISAKLSQTAFPSRFMLGTDWGKAVGIHPWEVHAHLLLMCSLGENELPALGLRTWHHMVI